MTGIGPRSVKPDKPGRPGRQTEVFLDLVRYIRDIYVLTPISIWHTTSISPTTGCDYGREAQRQKERRE
jgi:hypothetical protein